MKKEIGQRVKVTLNKGVSDYGYIADPEELRFKIAKNNVAVKITKVNSMMGKKGTYQFNISNVENI